MSRRTARALVVTLSLITLVLIAAGIGFDIVIYHGVKSMESLVESANYAMQTVTTVGYGNWERAALKTTPEFDSNDVLLMRGLSFIFMGLGATIYAVFTAVVVSIFVPPAGDSSNSLSPKTP